MTPETMVTKAGSERHQQQDYGACKQQQQQQPQQLEENALAMPVGNDEPMAWEERGNVVSDILEVAAVAFGPIFLHIALVTILQHAEGKFMECLRKEKPELKNYGEELLCHFHLSGNGHSCFNFTVGPRLSTKKGCTIACMGFFLMKVTLMHPIHSLHSMVAVPSLALSNLQVHAARGRPLMGKRTRPLTPCTH